MEDRNDTPGRNGEDGKDRDRPFDGQTFLYIRTHTADTGAEPLPSGLQHWHSPDIVIEKPGGALGGEAVADSENQVHVNVTNAGGVDAVDAFIDVFFANPSTGFTPATASLIGSGYLTIPGYSARQITFPWTPNGADAGHRCLFARVALYIPPDTYADPSVFDVRGDRHVAQRNIHVVALMRMRSMRFAFNVVNPLPRRLRTRLVAQEVRGEDAQQALRGALGCGFAQFGEQALRTVKIRAGKEQVRVPDDIRLEDRLRPRLTLPIAGLLQDDDEFNQADDAPDFELEPGEVRAAMLYVERNPETRRGDLHAIDIIQQDEEGETVGGLTVVVQH